MGVREEGRAPAYRRIGKEKIPLNPALRILFPLFAGLLAANAQAPFREWTLARALQILNASPWARHETFTRVIAGVGSGASGALCGMGRQAGEPSRRVAHLGTRLLPERVSFPPPPARGSQQ